MLSWEEFEEKEVKPVKAQPQEKKAEQATQPQEEKQDEQPRVALQTGSLSDRLERAKKAGLLVHTFWILGFPGETREEMQKTIDFALQCGADSFSFSILSPLPGTPIYRKVVKENLWWDGKSLNDLMFRSSLVKVDGFDGPYQFEKFVNEANLKANLLLKERDPKIRLASLWPLWAIESSNLVV